MKKEGILSLVVGVGMILVLTFPQLSTHAVPTASHESSTASPGVSGPPVGSASDQLRDLLLSPRGVEAAPTTLGKPTGATQARVEQTYGKLPLTFEANQGQTDTRVKFLSRGHGYTLFLTPTEAVFVFAKREATAKRDKLRDLKPELRQPEKVTQTVVRMKLVGANPKPPIAGREELPGKVNYFIGDDPTKWRSNVPTYARVEYQNVYRGVNLVYYGNQRQLEYDFVVSPGADPKAIRLAFEGVDKLTLDARGNLVLRTAGGKVVQRTPLVYQETSSGRREISGRYLLKGKDRVGFEVAVYDRTMPLVIDPVLVYSTFLGGSSGEGGGGVALDSAGNAYVTGGTASADFPTTPGAPGTSFGGVVDAFVTKLNAAGSALVYSTYLGGSDEDLGEGIAVDAAGNAYVMGLTHSADFPTTPGAFDTTLNGIFNTFVTKLDPAGSTLIYSTFLGGSVTDDPSGVAVDAAGNAYVTGGTASADFPTTPGAFNTTLSGGFDAFVTKLNSAGSALIYSTFLGGSSGDDSSGIAVDASGNAYVIGHTTSTDFPTTPGAFATTLTGGNDAFVTKLDPTGSTFVYSTYLGGSSDEEGSGIAVDASGNAYVTGETLSTDFPTTPGAFLLTFSGDADAFVTKLDPTGSALVYSTFLGGISNDDSSGIAVDSAGSAYVTGGTASADFPTTPGAIQTTFGGLTDAFVTKLNPTGSALIYSTYLGGSDGDGISGIAVDAAGNAYVTGGTGSTDFPTTPGAFATTLAGFGDAIVAKIAEINTPMGTNVVVQPVDLATGTTPATLTFSTVTQEGVTGLVTSSMGPTPPTGFQLVSPGLFYDLTTTAVFSGPVTVCINNSGVTSTSQLFHFEGGVWVDRTVSVDTVNHIICAEVTSLSPFAIFESSQAVLTSLGPANIWVGLKNSDDVGIRFDLRAEMYRNGSELVGSGEVTSVPGGSSGFNNAKLHTIPLTLSAPVPMPAGSQVSIKLLVRNACTGSGKNSGGARLWFNDAAADSRFDATIGSPATYYLRDGFALAITPGPGPKKTIDVAAGAKCSPFKSFGTWSVTLP